MTPELQTSKRKSRRLQVGRVTSAKMQETIVVEENTVRVPPWKGRDNRLGAYFVQLGSLLAKTVEDAAAACFADLVIDLGTLPPAPDKVARLVMDLRDRATKMAHVRSHAQNQFAGIRIQLGQLWPRVNVREP